VAPPDGKSCASAIPLSLGNNSFTNTFTDIVVDTAGVGCGFTVYTAVYQTNFYAFVPPSTGFYLFSTCGTANFVRRITHRKCGSANVSSPILLHSHAHVSVYITPHTHTRTHTIGHEDRGDERLPPERRQLPHLQR
jgi:hypothetical protein